MGDAALGGQMILQFFNLLTVLLQLHLKLLHQIPEITGEIQGQRIGGQLIVSNFHCLTLDFTNSPK